MKFNILALMAAVAAQDESDQATCTGPADCPAVDGADQVCATMVIGEFSVDQCVAKILCNETIEQDGQEMTFTCSMAYKMAASAALLMTAIASQQ